jgi:hypothetical protein
MTTLNSELSKLLTKQKKEIAVLKKEFVETGKKLFNEAMRTIFEKHPYVESFSWVQYASNHDDGNYSPPSIGEEYDILTTDGEEIEEVWGYGAPTPADDRDTLFCKDVNKIFRELGTEILIPMFGEDEKITMNRNGKTTSEEHYRY